MIFGGVMSAVFFIAWYHLPVSLIFAILSSILVPRLPSNSSELTTHLSTSEYNLGFLTIVLIVLGFIPNACEATNSLALLVHFHNTLAVFHIAFVVHITACSHNVATHLGLTIVNISNGFSDINSHNFCGSVTVHFISSRIPATICACGVVLSHCAWSIIPCHILFNHSTVCLGWNIILPTHFTKFTALGTKLSKDLPTRLSAVHTSAHPVHFFHNGSRNFHTSFSVLIVLPDK
jgi:hypothetical protein